jgi:hypothetical protein
MHPDAVAGERRIGCVPRRLTTRRWASARLSPAGARLKRCRKRRYHRQNRRRTRMLLRALLARNTNSL